MRRSTIEIINDPKFLETLARVEHDHWIFTVSKLAETGRITPSAVGEITKFVVPYDQLPEEVKEERREWAWRVVKEIAVALLTDEMVPDQHGG